MGDDEEFGPASVQYGDWRGTASLDDADISHDSLYQVAGVDRDQWWIIGLDLYGGDASAGGRVLAVPRDEYLGHDALLAANTSGSPIHVTAFELPYGRDQNPLVQFKRWNIRATPRELDLDLIVDETRSA